MVRPKLFDIKEAEWLAGKPNGRILFFQASENFTIQYGEATDPHGLSPHSHPFPQIAYIQQGSCDFYSSGVPYDLDSGCFMIVPPNVEHYMKAKGPVPVINVDIFNPGRADRQTSRRVVDRRHKNWPELGKEWWNDAPAPSPKKQETWQMQKPVLFDIKETQWTVGRENGRIVFFQGDEKISIQYCEARAPFPTNPHKHDDEQIAYIQQGEADFWVDGIPYEMDAGCFIVIPPNVEHYMEAKGNQTIIDIDFLCPKRNNRETNPRIRDLGHANWDK